MLPAVRSPALLAAALLAGQETHCNQYNGGLAVDICAVSRRPAAATLSADSQLREKIQLAVEELINLNRLSGGRGDAGTERFCCISILDADTEIAGIYGHI